MAQKTAEYQTLRSSFHSVCSNISKQPATIIPLANDLCAAKLLNEATRSAIQTTKGVPAYDLASQLVSAIHATIKLDKDKFYVFVEKLRDHGYVETAEQIQHDCEIQGGVNPLDFTARKEVHKPGEHKERIDITHHAFAKPPSIVDLTNKVAVPLQHKWREIGIQLGVSPGKLDAIYDRRNRNALQCITDVLLDEWEKLDAVPYTWGGLIRALESPYVGETVNANDLKAFVLDTINK